MLRDFIAIDFETANQQPSSVCSVGVVMVRDGQIVDSFYSLIQPEPNYYNYWCQRLQISNRTQFRILPPKGRSVALQSAINCIRSSYARLLPTGRKKEHPIMSQQPYYDSSSGAKLRISEQNTKFI